jgi:hypothetical protein
MKRRDFLVATAGFAGSILPVAGRTQVRPCPPSTLSVEGGQSSTTSCTNLDAESDWQQRISGAGVVWFHDFRTDAEVDNFRWTAGYRGGNDPQALGTNANWCRRITTDGVTGGGCLEIFRAAGTQEGPHWWRPFSALSGSGNGKASDDPAAGGQLPVHAYTPTDGGSQIYNWGLRGYYGHSSYHKDNVFDGTDYFLQMRVKMDPRRTAAGNSQVGKLMWHTTTRATNTAQQLVPYSGSFPVSGVGQPNYLRVFGGGDHNPLDGKDSIGNRGNQPGSEFGDGRCYVNDSDARRNCWAWSGGWDTLLFHLVPGRSGVTESQLQIFAAHEGETVYTKIWDSIWSNGYSYSDGSSALYANGYNAITLANFQNGLQNGEFWHRYDQVIFSRQSIPCPQA